MNIYELAKILSQAVANAYDGGAQLGLKREEGVPIYDSRVMDGFGIQLAGKILTVTYNSQIHRNEIANVEKDCSYRIGEIIGYLKSVYTGKGGSLSLKPVGEIYCRVETISINPSDIRVLAKQAFEISNVELNESNWKDMLSKGLTKSRKEKTEKTIDDTLFKGIARWGR